VADGDVVLCDADSDQSTAIQDADVQEFQVS
jgi:hypothetical protein